MFSRILRICGALLASGALLFALSACGTKEKTGIVGEGNFPTASGMMDGKNGPAPGTGQQEAENGIPDARSPEEAREATPQDFPERLGGEKIRGGEPVPELPNVYFGYDSYELDQSAKTQLARNAAYLKKNPRLYVILRGHTDEQGTEEYNFSLGSRRAQAVRDELIQQGLNGDRIQTVSYGEAIPLVEGEDDAARAQNRRVEFFVFTLPTSEPGAEMETQAEDSE